MKKNSIQLSLIIIMVILQTAVIHAERYDSVVTGKGDSAADIAAVQRAVDQGGSVLLKGHFDFGRGKNVSITKDVDIQGEIDESGTRTTTISGGLWSLHSPLPAILPPNRPGPKVTIRNIHFDGALWAPISLPYCSGADIINNKITNVLPIDNKMRFFGKEGVHRQQGIIFYPPYTLPNEYGKYQAGLISGNIIVTDNYIDLSNQIPEMTVAQGILVVGATGANIQILRNRIVNSSRNSVECIDNYPGSHGEGTTIINDNRIITADKGIPLPSPSTPNGIVAGWFIDPSGASDPTRTIRTVVSGNQIETRGETSIGIIVMADHAVITANHINLNGGKQAKGILHFNSNGAITSNRFSGSGLAGIMLTPWKTFAGNQNTLINNDFIDLRASVANVLMKSSDNIVVGECGRLIDNGKTNLILK